MVDYISFINVNGNSIQINAEDGPFPMTSLEYEIQTRRDQQSRVLEQGVWPSRQFDDVRTIHMEGDILVGQGGSLMQLVRQFSAAFATSPQLENTRVGTFRIKYTDFADELFAFCSLDGHPSLPLAGLSPQYTNWQVSLIADDPYLYFVTPQFYTTSASVSIGGIILDNILLDGVVFPGGVGGSQDIVNTGDVEVPAQVTIYGPCKSPRLRIVQDLTGLDQQLVFTGLTLAVGDSVIVNFAARQATWAGAASVYQLVDPTQSRWWKIPAGTSTFQFTAQDAAPPSRAEILFQPAVLL